MGLIREFWEDGFANWTGQLNGPTDRLSWRLMRIRFRSNKPYTWVGLFAHPVRQYPFGFTYIDKPDFFLLSIKILWIRAEVRIQ